MQCRLLQDSYWCVLVTKTKRKQALLPLLCLFYFLATYARICWMLGFRILVKLFYRNVLPGRDSLPAYGAIPQAWSIIPLKTNASAPELYRCLSTISCWLWFDFPAMRISVYTFEAFHALAVSPIISKLLCLFDKFGKFKQQWLTAWI